MTMAIVTHHSVFTPWKTGCVIKSYYFMIRGLPVREAASTLNGSINLSNGLLRLPGQFSHRNVGIAMVDAQNFPIRNLSGWVLYEFSEL